MKNTISTNPEILTTFAIELGKYTETLCAKIIELRAFHDRAADYWQGPQYDSLTEKITRMSQQVLTEVEKLGNLKNFIVQKAVELASAQGIRFGGDE